IAAGTAIAVAATGGGPVPKAKPLARAVHDALAAKPVKGITADVSFTNNLISSADIPGETADPLLQGTLPADESGKAAAKHADAHHGIPTVAQIQSHLTQLMRSVDVGGVATSNPGDIAGRPAYSVAVSPKHSAGLL